MYQSKNFKLEDSEESGDDKRYLDGGGKEKDDEELIQRQEMILNEKGEIDYEKLR